MRIEGARVRAACTVPWCAVENSEQATFRNLQALDEREDGFDAALIHVQELPDIHHIDLQRNKSLHNR